MTELVVGSKGCSWLHVSLWCVGSLGGRIFPVFPHPTGHIRPSKGEKIGFFLDGLIPSCKIFVMKNTTCDLKRARQLIGSNKKADD